MKKTSFTIDGYFTRNQAEKIKEVMTGRTYMDFKIDMAGDNINTAITVSTREEGITKSKLKETFYNTALFVIADYQSVRDIVEKYSGETIILIDKTYEGIKLEVPNASTSHSALEPYLNRKVIEYGSNDDGTAVEIKI